MITIKNYIDKNTMPSFFLTFAPHKTSWEQSEIIDVYMAYTDFLESTYQCNAWRGAFGYGSKLDNPHFHFHIVGADVQGRTLKRRFLQWLQQEKGWEHVYENLTTKDHFFRYELRKGKFSDVDAYLDENEDETRKADHTIKYTGCQSDDYDKERNKQEPTDRVLNINQYFRILFGRVEGLQRKYGEVNQDMYDDLLQEIDMKFFLHRLHIEEKMRLEEDIRKKMISKKRFTPKQLDEWEKAHEVEDDLQPGDSVAKRASLEEWQRAIDERRVYLTGTYKEDLPKLSPLHFINDSDDDEEDTNSSKDC